MVWKAQKKVFSVLCRAYILGDILQDVDFKDALVDVFIHQVMRCTGWPSEEARYVYGNTMKDAPLRRVLAAFTAADVLRSGYFDKPGIMGEGLYWEAAQKYSTVEFLCDVLRLVDKRLNPGGGEQEEDQLQWHEDTCRYHEHEEGQC